MGHNPSVGRQLAGAAGLVCPGGEPEEADLAGLKIRKEAKRLVANARDLLAESEDLRSQVDQAGSDPEKEALLAKSRAKAEAARSLGKAAARLAGGK
jgi:hypothetical protein